MSTIRSGKGSVEVISAEKTELLVRSWTESSNTMPFPVVRSMVLYKELDFGLSLTKVVDNNAQLGSVLLFPMFFTCYECVRLVVYRPCLPAYQNWAEGPTNQICSTT